MLGPTFSVDLGINVENTRHFIFRLEIWSGICRDEYHMCLFLSSQWGQLSPLHGAISPAISWESLLLTLQSIWLETVGSKGSHYLPIHLIKNSNLVPIGRDCARMNNIWSSLLEDILLPNILLVSVIHKMAPNSNILVPKLDLLGFHTSNNMKIHFEKLCLDFGEMNLLSLPAH